MASYTGLPDQFDDFDSDVYPRIIAELDSGQASADHAVGQLKVQAPLLERIRYCQDRDTPRSMLADVEAQAEKIKQDLDRIGQIIPGPAPQNSPELEEAVDMFKSFWNDVPGFRERIMEDVVRKDLVPKLDSARDDLEEARRCMGGLEGRLETMSHKLADLDAQSQVRVEAAPPASEQPVVKDARLISVGQEYCRSLKIKETMITADISKDMVEIGELLKTISFKQASELRFWSWAPSRYLGEDKGTEQSPIEFLFKAHHEPGALNYCGLSRSLKALLRQDASTIHHSACIIRVALARLLAKKYKSMELLFISYRLLEFLVRVFKDKEALKPLLEQISALHTREEKRKYILLRGLEFWTRQIFYGKAANSPQSSIYEIARQEKAIIPTPRVPIPRLVYIADGDRLLVFANPDLTGPDSTLVNVDLYHADEYKITMEDRSLCSYLEVPCAQIKHSIAWHDETWYREHLPKALKEAMQPVVLDPEEDEI